MILGIDTSLGTAVAVVERDGLVRAAESRPDPLAHAEVIGELLHAALADAALGPIGGTGAATPPSLTHVAAGMGPGPFTGLRVGIAAARAFALGRGIPCLPVASHDAIALDAMLSDAFAEPRRLAVVTDARRREFAFTVYDGVDDDGLPVRVTEPALVPRTDVDAALAPHGAMRVDAERVSAAMVALVASRALEAGRPTGPAAPLYLRAPDVTPSAAPKRVGA